MTGLFDSKDEYIANDYIEKEVGHGFKEAVDEKKILKLQFN